MPIASGIMPMTSGIFFRDSGTMLLVTNIFFLARRLFFRMLATWASWNVQILPCSPLALASHTCLHTYKRASSSMPCHQKVIDHNRYCTCTVVTNVNLFTALQTSVLNPSSLPFVRASSTPAFSRYFLNSSLLESAAWKKWKRKKVTSKETKDREITPTCQQFK